MIVLCKIFNHNNYGKITQNREDIMKLFSNMQNYNNNLIIIRMLCTTYLGYNDTFNIIDDNARDTINKLASNSPLYLQPEQQVLGRQFH